MNHEQKKYRNKLNGYGVTFIVWMADSGLILSTISLNQ